MEMQATKQELTEYYGKLIGIAAKKPRTILEKQQKTGEII
jgi:hypothetical protein